MDIHQLPLPCRRTRTKSFHYLHHLPPTVCHNTWIASQWRCAKNGIQGKSQVIKETWGWRKHRKDESSSLGYCRTLVVFALLQRARWRCHGKQELATKESACFQRNRWWAHASRFRGTQIMLAPKLDRPGTPPGYWRMVNGRRRASAHPHPGLGVVWVQGGEVLAYVHNK